MAAALFGIGALSAPLLGPTLGGYLIAWSSWHWIFLVNLPIGIVVVLLTLRFIEEPGFTPPRGSEIQIDWVGMALLAVGMASLQYVLEEGNRDGWFESRIITVLAAVALSSLSTFVVHELEVAHPVVDLRVFRRRSYAAGTALNFLTGFALFSCSFMFSLFAGSVLHWEALQIGQVSLVSGVISLFVMPVLGSQGHKVDARLLLTVGVSTIAFSQVVMARLTQDAGFWDTVEPNLLRSFGLGFIFIPASVVALSDIEPRLRGNATALFNLTRELGGSLGTAAMGTLVSNGVKRHVTYLAESVNVYSETAREQLQMLASGVGSLTYQRELIAETIMVGRVHAQALVLSFADGFRVLAWIMALGLVFVALLDRPSQPTGPVAGH